MAEGKVLENVKKYISKLDEAGIKIEKAFLFGSFAHGNANELSDIDLMIISRKFDDNNDECAGIVWKLTRNIDTRIEPYMIGLEKFNNDKVSPLLQIVRKEGISISL